MALVLALADRDPGFADAVMAVSPGECFQRRNFISRDAGKLPAPAFLTAARGEAGQRAPIFDAIPGSKTGFQPEGAERHRATALLTAAGQEYRTALERFLMTHLPAR